MTCNVILLLVLRNIYCTCKEGSSTSAIQEISQTQAGLGKYRLESEHLERIEAISTSPQGPKLLLYCTSRPNLKLLTYVLSLILDPGLPT